MVHKFRMVKIKAEDDELVRKVAEYYHMSKADLVRMLVVKEARALGLLTNSDKTA